MAQQLADCKLLFCIMSGEDGEDLSAAGQMDTILGVKGYENIIKAVKQCWASHFTFLAVQYKR